MGTQSDVATGQAARIWLAAEQSRPSVLRPILRQGLQGASGCCRVPCARDGPGWQFGGLRPLRDTGWHRS